MNYQNFGDAIIKTLLTTYYTKKRINHLLLFGITLLCRSIINFLMCFIIYTDIWGINFTIQILIGIILVLKTNYIYFFVKKYETETFNIASYLVSNYSPDNFRKWKKGVVIVVSMFYIIYLRFVPITSDILIEYIMQFLICYLIVDNIENNNGIIFDIYNKVLDKKYVRVYKKADIIFIDNYNPNENETIVSTTDKTISIIDEDFVMFDEKKNN